MTTLGKTMRAGVAAMSLALAAPLLMMPMPMAAYAQTQDVLLENIDLGPVKIGKIALTGTNATQDQVQALVTGQMPPADMQGFLKGLTAETITVEGVALSPPEGGSIAVASVAVEGLEAAAGKVGKLTVSGLEAKDIVTPTGPVNMSISEVSLAGLEAADLIAAAEAGDPSTVFADPTKLPKFDSLTIGASEVSGPLEGAAAPNNIVNVKLGSASLTMSDFLGRVATGAEYAFNNVVMKFPEGSEPATQLKAMGYDELDVSIGGKGSWNKDAKTYAIENLNFVVANGAKLNISTTLGNIDETFFTGDPQTAMMAMLSAGVSDATISLENNGLVEKGIAFAAAQQGQDPAAMQAQAQAMATTMLPAILGSDPGATALATALGEFAASPKNLTISAKAKSGMLTAQDFAAVASPADIFSKIDLEATANQ